MAVFSTDQNRQFYHVSAYKSNVTGFTNDGDATVVTDKDGNIHIIQRGKGGLVKTDVIDKANILSVNASAPADMVKKLKQVNLTLSKECNGGKPIIGEDYILRINFRQLYGMSDEDIYQKYGAVAATSAMVEKTDLFYLTLAQSLFKNFKRTFSPLLKIGLNTASGTTAITSISNVNGTWKVNGSTVTPGTTYTGIAIIEDSLVGEWQLGTAKLEGVNFEVIPTTVLDNGQDIVWGTTTTAVAGTIGNGYDTADLEYFCMGERGDQYRLAQWPNNITTKYFVNPTSTYYYLDIAYAYKGDCEDIQNSKKVMTLVSPTKAEFKKLAKALTTAGLVIKATKACEDDIQGDTTGATANNGVLDASELA